MSAVQSDAQNVTWNQEQTERWLAAQHEREAQLAPVSVALFEQARLQPGMTVLDVGCGGGPTTVEAARRVTPGGQVTGLDVSPGMIDVARAGASGTDISWLVADASSHQFEPGGFDVIISRFGVMFFADPVAAFRNLLSACRLGGRLVMAVWPERDKSALFDVPLQVVTRTLDRLGTPFALPRVDEVPFGLGDPGRLRRTLESAGWSPVTAEPDQRTLYLGGPGTSPEQAVASALGLGVLRGVMESQPADVVAAVEADLLADFRERHDGTGVGLPGGFLIVTAHRGEPATTGS